MEEGGGGGVGSGEINDFAGGGGGDDDDKGGSEGGCKVNPQRGDRCGRRTAIHGKLNVISKVHLDSVQLLQILEKFTQRFYSIR